jgi:hypothetical protein
MAKGRIENVHDVIPLSRELKIRSTSLFIRCCCSVVVTHPSFVHSLRGNRIPVTGGDSRRASLGLVGLHYFSSRSRNQRSPLIQFPKIDEELHDGVSHRTREVVCLTVTILLCGCNRSHLHGKGQRYTGNSHNELANRRMSRLRKSGRSQSSPKSQNVVIVTATARTAPQMA